MHCRAFHALAFAMGLRWELRRPVPVLNLGFWHAIFLCAWPRMRQSMRAHSHAWMVDFGTVLRGVLTLMIVVSQLCRMPLWDAAAICHSKAAVQPSPLSSLSVPTDVLFLASSMESPRRSSSKTARVVAADRGMHMSHHTLVTLTASCVRCVVTLNLKSHAHVQGSSLTSLARS